MPSFEVLNSFSGYIFYENPDLPLLLQNPEKVGTKITSGGLNQDFNFDPILESGIGEPC